VDPHICFLADFSVDVFSSRNLVKYLQAAWRARQLGPITSRTLARRWFRQRLGARRPSAPRTAHAGSKAAWGIAPAWVAGASTPAPSQVSDGYMRVTVWVGYIFVLDESTGWRCIQHACSIARLFFLDDVIPYKQSNKSLSGLVRWRCIFFWKIQYKRRRSHTCVYTHSYERIHTLPLWAPSENWAMDQILKLTSVLRWFTEYYPDLT
jgi:hypothetical protein